jgi:hypothetical protein
VLGRPGDGGRLPGRYGEAADPYCPPAVGKTTGGLEPRREHEKPKD